MNVFTLKEFDELEKSVKADIIYCFGVYLSHYRKDRYIFALYEFCNFYVEMVYVGRDKVLLEMKLYSSTDQLENYLNTFSLQELGFD